MSQHRPDLVPAIFALLSFSMFCAVPVRAAQADSCIEKPNATAPQGEHWYYRTDRDLGRQCWYLGPEDDNERAARKPSDRSTSDVSARSVAQQQTSPPAATETKFATVTDPSPWPATPQAGPTNLPLMPPLLFRMAPTPTSSPAEQPQTSDAADPPPAPASDAASEPESPALAQSSAVPAQSAGDPDHTVALAMIAFLTIAIFIYVLEVMRWVRRRKITKNSNQRAAPDWDALFESARESPGVNSTKPPRRLPQPARPFAQSPPKAFVPPAPARFVPPPSGSVVPPPPGAFANTEKLAEDLQKILDELRTRETFSMHESGDLMRSG